MNATNDQSTMTEQKPVIELHNVSKFFGDEKHRIEALRSFTLDIKPGEFVCLVGASGCGKSTLLSLLAGLDSASTGEVTTRGRTALMFQEAALFPWRTAAGNIDLALKLRSMKKQERAQKTAELLSVVRLSDAAKKLPHQLSGGMRQRVALARAFAQDADILLMDEPFGALDAITRDVLHDELERLWLERKFTTVFVTHNVREAARLGDRVIVLTSRPGRIANELEIDLPRPRRMDSPEVANYAAQITKLLRTEVRRHAHDTRTA